MVAWWQWIAGKTLKSPLAGTEIVALSDGASKKTTAQDVADLRKPAGSDTHVQFNDGGAFAGEAGMVYNKTTDTLTVAGGVTINGQAAVVTNDARLSDARTPTAHNQAFSTITSTPTTLAGYGITDAAPSSHAGAGGAAHADAVAGGAAGFMTGADKTKLDGIAAGAEVNQNAWTTITVSGQSDVVADGKTDTLTLIAGTNVTLSTNATNDSVTIAASPSSFGTVAVSGQDSVVADQHNDTLTLAAGTNITITTNAAGDTVTIAASGAAAGDFSGPASSTDNALVRFDGASGKTGQNSGVIVDDTDNVTGMATLTLPNTGLHLLDTNASHDLIIAPGSDLTADHTLTITTGDADRTLTVAGNASVNGTNTGDQTITLEGDVTGTGTGTFTATIANDAVTYAKLQNVSATDRLLGRDTALAGGVEELTVGGGIEFTGSGGIQTSAFTGDVTKAAGGTATTIANDVVTFAKMQNSSAASKLLGRGSASGAGDFEEITVGAGLAISGVALTVDAELAAIAGLTSAADKVPYFTGSGTADVATVTAAARTVLDDASVTAMLTTLGGIGKQSLWIPAVAIIPSASGGCAALTTVATSANRPDLSVLDFDGTTAEYAQFAVAMPAQWDEGTVTYQVFWTVTAAVTTTVSWNLQGVAVSNDDTIDVAYGTAIEVEDTGLNASNDLHVSAESGAVTIAGTPAAGDVCYFRIYRNPADANDNMTQDARLIGVKLFWTQAAGVDG